MGLIAVAAHCGRFIFPCLFQPHLNGPDRVLDDDDASLLIDTRNWGFESSTAEKVPRLVTRITLQAFVDVIAHAPNDTKFRPPVKPKLYLVIP